MPCAFFHLYCTGASEAKESKWINLNFILGMCWVFLYNSAFLFDQVRGRECIKRNL